jgi:dynein light chain 1
MNDQLTFAGNGLKCVTCRVLSLSTNQIEKISNLQGLRMSLLMARSIKKYLAAYAARFKFLIVEFLRKLSLGRNYIKKIEGLDAVADTLEELWVSYNQIERLNGVECCKKLKVLYASNNKIKAWEGVNVLVCFPFDVT